MRIFYVIHIGEKALADSVDAIRFICNPTEKQRAHLTVRGPYQKRINISELSKKIVGDTVSIDRVGNFFDSGQNTVFFHCHATDLERVWNKPHYPFNPHISLYDGNSREFAERLYELVSRYSYCLKFQADELEAIESKKGQTSLSLALAFNSDFVSQVVGEQINADAVSSLSEDRRLQLVERICQHLAEASAKSGSERSYIPRAAV
jgi:hypothetical protein